MDGHDALERLPPQNLDAEQCVLGSMLLHRDAIGEVLLHITAEDFYAPAHGEVFSVLSDLYDANKPVDLLLAVEELKSRGQLETVGGVPVLAGLMETVHSAANAEAYAKLVREAAERRRLVTAATEILKQCYRDDGLPVEALVEKAEQAVFDVSHGNSAQDIASMQDLVRIAVERIDKLQDEDAEVTSGVSTHYSDLDRLLDGLAPGSLYVIAGRPSMGKSSFATSVLANICIRDGIPAILFTLEVPAEKIAENMLCSDAGVDIHRLLRGQLSNEEYSRVPVAAGRLSKAPLFVDDTPAITLTRMRSLSRRLCRKHEIGLIVVDYMQLMTLGTHVESRQLEISRLSAGLKQLARELKVPVIALSQLNRGVESRQDKRPLMGDLRESGSIEQDADAIMLVFRKEYYFPDDVAAKGKAEIIVAKNRNGPTGVAELNFHASWMRFENAHHFPETSAPSVPTL